MLHRLSCLTSQETGSDEFSWCTVLCIVVLKPIRCTMKIYIYALLDPNKNIRYVGKTTDLKKRLQQHCSDKELSRNTHKANWIRSLIRDGTTPTIIVLEEVIDSDWEAVERRWIQKCVDDGCDLTNLTSGGDGLHNPSEITRQKLRENQIRRMQDPTYRTKIFTQDRRDKISSKKMGVSRSAFTDSWKQNISNAITGSNNPMFGKHFLDVWTVASGSDWASERYAQYVDKVSDHMSGSNNPMSGKYMTDIWIEKYGPEEARRKFEEVNERRRESCKRAALKRYGKT